MSGDPYGWNQQRANIIAQQQAARSRYDQDTAAGTAAYNAAQYDSGGYGAVAFSIRVGRYGWSYGYPDRASAERAALEQCGVPGAVIVGWGRDVYIAFARADKGNYGFGWADRPRRARKLALEACGPRAENPRVVLEFHSAGRK